MTWHVVCGNLSLAFGDKWSENQESLDCPRSLNLILKVREQVLKNFQQENNIRCVLWSRPCLSLGDELDTGPEIS